METIDIGQFVDCPEDFLKNLKGCGMLVTRDVEPYVRIVPADANPQVLLIGQLSGEILADPEDELLSATA